MTPYAFDPSHSEITFSARHMMFARVRGRFTDWSASLAFDPRAPMRARTRVQIQAASIQTGEPQRDGHLRSADFLDAETHPSIVFESKGATSPRENEYALVGDLTIRGVTHEITLRVEATGSGKDPWGNERVGFHITGQLRRSDWGLTWNAALESGGILVGDTVDIDAEVQLRATP